MDKDKKKKRSKKTRKSGKKDKKDKRGKSVRRSKIKSNTNRVYNSNNPNTCSNKLGHPSLFPLVQYSHSEYHSRNPSTLGRISMASYPNRASPSIEE